MTELLKTSAVQDYSLYEPEHFKVWEILFDRQMAILKDRAAEVFMEGIRQIHFTADRIPKFDEFNIRLDTITGWQAVVVPGLIDNKDFLNCCCIENSRHRRGCAEWNNWIISKSPICFTMSLAICPC